nr:penicillin-binding protein [Candidatus Levybacteria bacterium]
MQDFRSRRRRNASLNELFVASKLIKLAFFGLIACIIIGFGIFLWFSRDLPTPGKLSAQNLSQSTKVYDRNGTVLYDVYDGNINRTYMALPNIATTFQQATIAIEDKDFYTNGGFSMTGYLRSVRNFIFARGISGGGSTLTQQLVKNTLLTSEQTLPRKIKELILSVQVDQKYSKDQILELYLNIAPYGGTAVGVESASELYFGKKAKNLSLVESAILAGMPQSPSYYSPYGEYPKAYIIRATDVLRRMREDGYITEDEEEKAVKALPKVKFQGQRQAIKAPHFSFYIKKLLSDRFGEAMVESGGLQVHTTLDYALQKEAEDIVKEEVEKSKNLKVGNGASVVLNPKNGEILAMVGSKDFFETESEVNTEKDTTATPFEGQYNVITEARRQPGSSIKPVTYAAALEKGYTASTLLMDTKTVFHNPGEKDYEPVNYDGKFRGPSQMRFALGNSLNIPAVKMLAQVGVKNMLQMAYNMGISTFAPTNENMNRFGLAVTLGGAEVQPLELASSFSAFANGGYKTEPVAILKVTDRNGKVLYEYKDPSEKRVIPEEVAFIISHMLLDNNARADTFGTNSYLHIAGRSVAVKTGTTDDKRDNWTIGWTPSVLVLTWVGNNDNSTMSQSLASGVTGAAPIWRRIMVRALAGKPSEEFKKPDNVNAIEIDAYGGGLPVDGRPKRTEYFIKGTEPTSPSKIYKDIKVSKSDNNKLASDSEVSKGEYDTKKFIVFEENDPVSSDGKNRWQEGIDEWIKATFAADKPEYYPPKEKSDKQVEGE